MRFTIIVGLLALSWAAQAQVYQRIDPLTGQITYTNVKPRGQASEDNPAPEPSRVSAPVVEEAAPRPSIKRSDRVIAPASFPRISSAEQKQRDADRYAILQDELQFESAALRAVPDTPANQDMIRRHRANIASLRRELAKVR